MRIQFERTGGFAGMRIAVSVDTASLPADEARELIELVEAAQFFGLPPDIQSPTGADQFHYKLTVEAEGRQHTIEAGDAAAPERLQPLFLKLTRLARRSE